MASACLIGVDPTATNRIVDVLHANGHRVTNHLPPGAAPPSDPLDVIFAGGGPDQYLRLLADVRKKHHVYGFIVVGQRPSTTQWLDAIEAGASDYLATPPNEREILWALQSIGISRGVPAPKRPRTPEDILQDLNTQVDAAFQRFEEASRHFREIAGNVPSGMTSPNEAGRIQLASQAQRAAAEEVNQALRRRDDFLVDGKVPDDPTPTPYQQRAAR